MIDRLVDELAGRIARLERLVDYWQRTGAAPTPDSKADGAVVEREPRATSSGRQDTSESERKNG